MKFLSLTILGVDTTFFDNMIFFIEIRTIFFRTIDRNMPIFFAKKHCRFLEVIGHPCPWVADES